MRKKEYQQLVKKAEELKGRRKKRFISELEIDKMRILDRKLSLKGKRIRIYSFDGFVANSYKYKADIDYIERQYDSDGNKKIIIGQTSAKRPFGNAPLIAVNNKGI